MRSTDGPTFVTLLRLSPQIRIRIVQQPVNRMDQQAFQEVNQNSPEAIPTQMRQIDGREWWLWGFAIAVTLALTLGIVSFTFPWFRWDSDASYWFDLGSGYAGWRLWFYSSTSTPSTSIFNYTAFDANSLSGTNCFSSSVKMPPT